MLARLRPRTAALAELLDVVTMPGRLVDDESGEPSGDDAADADADAPPSAIRA